MTLTELIATTACSMLNELRQVQNPERGSMLEVLHHEAVRDPIKVARACVQRTCEEMGLDPDCYEVAWLRVNEENTAIFAVREASAVDRLARLV